MPQPRGFAAARVHLNLTIPNISTKLEKLIHFFKIID